jgi:hypothetical protein
MSPEQPVAGRFTDEDIERRLYDLVDPALRQRGGLAARFVELGRPGRGLVLILGNEQQFDLEIREHVQPPGACRRQKGASR